jgi:hypothetical protein
MRFGKLAFVIALCFGTMAFGDEAVKPFTGTWTARGDTTKDGPTTWVFEENGDSLKISQMKGAEKLAEFECNTRGRECQIKEAGKHATVSMWFNGPKLVELETRGSEVIKRRFAVSGKGDAMDVEIIPISQEAKSETLHFTRSQTSAHNQ